MVEPLNSFIEESNGYIIVPATTEKLPHELASRIADIALSSRKIIITNITERGSCTSPGVDPDQFFTNEKRGNEKRTEKTKTAKDICNSCIVNSDCRIYHLLSGVTDYDHGIFGGLDEFEREDIREIMINDSRYTPPKRDYNQGFDLARQQSQRSS